jgi:hypothetical protein
MLKAQGNREVEMQEVVVAVTQLLVPVMHRYER